MAAVIPSRRRNAAASVAAAATVALLALFVPPFGRKLLYFARDHAYKPSLANFQSSANNNAAQHRRWVAIIDAGSTGTRIHVFGCVYEPEVCRGAPGAQYRVELPEKTLKISPGIADVYHADSNNLNQPDISAPNSEGSKPSRDMVWDRMEAYFNRLQKFMEEVVPSNEIQQSVVMFRGTAGMREMAPAAQIGALNVVRQIIGNWNVTFRPDWAHILDGTSEGVYGWLLLNQLAEKFGAEDTLTLVEGKPPKMADAIGAETLETRESSAKKKQQLSIVMVEMGGMSAQVVMDQPLQGIVEKYPTRGDSGGDSAVVTNSTDQRYATVTLCGSQRSVIAQSFAGMGRQMAMQRYITEMLRTYLLQLREKLATAPAKNDVSQHVVEMACLPRGASFNVPTGPLDRRILNLLVSESFAIANVSNLLRRDDEKFDAAVLTDIQILVTGAGEYEQCYEEVVKYIVPSEATAADTEMTSSSEGSTTEERVMSQRLPVEAVNLMRDSETTWHSDEHTDEDKDDNITIVIAATESFYYFHRYVSNSREKYFSPADFYSRAKELCGLSAVEVRDKIDVEAAEEKSVAACFGLVFLGAFLEGVLGIERERHVWALNELSGIGITWPAGFLMGQIPDVFA